MAIFMPPNKYGYRVNILDPRILPHYERFKKSRNIPPWCPLSDEERLEFENHILNWYLNKNPKYAHIISKAISEGGDIPEYHEE